MAQCVIRRKHTNSCIREVDKSRLWGNNLPIKPSAGLLWVGADLDKKSHLTRLGFEPGSPASQSTIIPLGHGGRFHNYLFIDYFLSYIYVAVVKFHFDIEK